MVQDLRNRYKSQNRHFSALGWRSANLGGAGHAVPLRGHFDGVFACGLQLALSDSANAARLDPGRDDSGFVYAVGSGGNLWQGCTAPDGARANDPGSTSVADALKIAARTLALAVSGRVCIYGFKSSSKSCAAPVMILGHAKGPCRRGRRMRRYPGGLSPSDRGFRKMPRQARYRADVSRADSGPVARR
jgi:hypothetical protein